MNAHQGLFKAALVPGALSVGSGWDGQSETVWAVHPAPAERRGPLINLWMRWGDSLNTCWQPLSQHLALSLCLSQTDTQWETQACLLGSVCEKQFWCWTRDYYNSNHYLAGYSQRNSQNAQKSCHTRGVWLSPAKHKQVILEIYFSSVGPYNVSGWWPTLKLQKANSGIQRSNNLNKVF